MNDVLALLHRRLISIRGWLVELNHCRRIGGYRPSFLRRLVCRLSKACSLFSLNWKVCRVLLALLFVLIAIYSLVR